MATTADKLAICNGLRVAHTVYAVCEVWFYDVWGNAEDGYEVNDRSCSEREARVPCDVRVSNFPRCPGAKDAYRSFPEDSASFSVEVCCSFTLSDREVKKAMGLTCAIETDGDGTHYYVERARDGRPIGEVIVCRWETE